MQQLGYNHPKLVDVDTFCCEACRHILLLMPFGMCYFLTGKYDQIWIGKIKQFAIWIGKKRWQNQNWCMFRDHQGRSAQGGPRQQLGALGLAEKGWFHMVSLFFWGIIGEIGELPVSCLVAQILVLIRLDRALNIPESTVADRHLVYAGIAHVWKNPNGFTAAR